MTPTDRAAIADARHEHMISWWRLAIAAGARRRAADGLAYMLRLVDAQDRAARREDQPCPR